jgi:ABC-type dipeptide/oligopeptide/nickel transport system ATPase component
VPLLEIDDLRTSFPTGMGEAYAVDGVSLTLDEGRTLDWSASRAAARR